MYDVLVVGELNVDIILNGISGFPEIGKEILSKEMTVTLGSSSAIFASNLSSLGTKVAFVGKIGKDNFGELTKESLASKDVDISMLIETSEHSTGATIILNYGMDRANVTYPGAMDHLSAKDITDEMLAKSRHLHVSSVFMQPALKDDLIDLFQRAKKLGLSTSIDPQWDPSEQWELDLKNLLPLVDIFLPNTKELTLITNSLTIRDSLKKIQEYANTIVIKDGENGAHLWQTDKWISKPAYLNEHVADCIGAGDSFDAGFISEFLKGKTIEECLDFGNLSGAINTTGNGGTSAFESIDRFKAIAKEKFEYEIV